MCAVPVTVVCRRADAGGYLIPAWPKVQLLRVIRSQHSAVPPATHVGHPGLAQAPEFGDALAMKEHQEHMQRMGVPVDVGSLISAIAAITAAVFAGVNLWI